MAYAPIAHTTPQYEDYPNWWLKAYEQGTTTPKIMALDSAGASTVAKLEINSDGFPESAGNALVIPYIDGDYDLWLFPTAAEADADDTSNALIFADDIDAGSTDIIAGVIDTERPVVATYAAMDTLPALATGTNVFLTGDGINGNWVVDDTGLTTNVGTIRDWNNSVGTQRLKRVYTGKLYVTWFGAVGDGNGNTDNTAAILATIVAARVVLAAASDLTNLTVWFPDQPDAYYHTGVIPVVSGIYLACAERHSVSLISDSAVISAYSATESGGVFTDNLDQPLNVNTAENNGIINLRFDHEGTIVGSSPSGVPYTHCVQLHNVPSIELFNLRVSVKTNWIGGISAKNSFRMNMYKPYVERNTGFYGGVGIFMDSISNASSIYAPFVFGGFAVGLWVGNPDTVSVYQPSIELNWLNMYLDGDAQRVDGGYYEGGKVCEISLACGSASTLFDWELNTPWLNGTVGLDMNDTPFSWVLSSSGTNEYYWQRDIGGNTEIKKVGGVTENGTPMSAGAAGALAAGTFESGADNDGLGYPTTYVRLTDSTDPDSKADGFLVSTNYAIMMGRCKGGEIKNAHFEGNFTTQFFSDTIANGNTGNKIKLTVGDASTFDPGTYGLNNGQNIVEVLSADAVEDWEISRKYSTSTTSEPESTALNQYGAQFCMFYLQIQNNAGTLEARIVDGDGLATAHDLCFVTSASAYTAFGADISAGQDFGASGVGRFSGVNNLIILNTNGQVAGQQAFVAGTITSTNGTVAVTANVRLDTRDIGGTTRYRVEIMFMNAITGASWDIDTTNLPTTKYVKVPFIGFAR